MTVLSNQPLTSAKITPHFGGIDFWRGIAMFGVVILHADEGIVNTPPAWRYITTVAGFAVPFFLATSFYFAGKSIYRKKGKFAWQNRLSRLLVPYILWSIIYLGYRSFKYLISQQPERIILQFKDPLSLIFFGSTTLHLYFLPLLITGMVLGGWLGSKLTRKGISSSNLIGLTLVSWLLYEILIQSGNDFQHISNVAFQPLLSYLSVTESLMIRLLSVELAWSLRCLPYLFLGLILAKIPVGVWSNSTYKWAIVFGGISIVFWGNLFLPPALDELLCGYGTLLIALVISPLCSRNTVIKHLGECAFGIYLVHLLLVETFQSVIARIYPAFIDETSTTALLVVAMVIFLLSWMLVSILRRKTIITRLKLL